jgi:hypothetical protein
LARGFVSIVRFWGWSWEYGLGYPRCITTSFLDVDTDEDVLEFYSQSDEPWFALMSWRIKLLHIETILDSGAILKED